MLECGCVVHEVPVGVIVYMVKECAAETAGEVGHAAGELCFTMYLAKPPEKGDWFSETAIMW